MKRLLSLALSICLVSVMAVDTAEARTQRKGGKAPKGGGGGGIAACSTIHTLPNGNYIYKNSAPLRTGGVGTPLRGYRKEPTLIFNTRNFAGGRHPIYGENGTLIHSGCPLLSAHGHAGRDRCTMPTSSLVQSARRAGGTGVYFKINGSTCVFVPHAGKCYGSVKGLCSSTIN